MFIQCKTYARGNSDVAYLLELGYYCHSKNKKWPRPELFPHPLKVYLILITRLDSFETFETKMTTHRDN